MTKIIKYLKITLLYYLILAILTISIVPVFAIGKNSININLKEIKDINFNPEGRKLKLWYVSDKKFADDELSEKIQNFNKLSVDELDKNFTDNFVTEKIDKSKELKLNDLKNGTYYVREVLRDGDKKHISSFFIRLSLEDGDTIYPKLVVDIPQNPPDTPPNTPPGTPPELPPGVVLVRKTSQNGERLKGAVFELYQKTPDGDVSVPLIKNSYNEKGSQKEFLVTDEIGEITIKNLPDGEYYFREIKAPDGYEIINVNTPFKVTNANSVILDIINKPSDGKGAHNFLKYDGDTDKALGGAVFKVTKYDEKLGSYTSVKVDGKDYIITSDDKGRFAALDLPYGEYFLWEIQAPKGYQLLNDGVSFIIDENSQYNRTDIANYKNPNIVPDKGAPLTPGMIPKTGDITLLILTVGGAILSSMGVYLVKKGNSY